MAETVEKKYLSPEEVGRLFRSSKWTVRRWVEAGRLPSVRLGRRLLIPAEAVEALVRGGISPADLKTAEHVPLAIVRGPVLRRDFFDAPLTAAEINNLTRTVLAALRIGGWPYDTLELKKEGIRKIILGEKVAPPYIWRYLCAAIEAISSKSGTTTEDEAGG